MKKVIAAVAMMAAFNDSVASAIILCILAVMFFAWMLREAEKHNNN